MKKVLNTEEKIKLIKKSKRLEDLKLEILPATDEYEYFFVSYSHKDYKDVFADIFRLKEQGIPIWYDKGRLPPGDEWPKVVERKIMNYACKGIIFYISEHTVEHPKQVERELEIALKSKKPFVSINLPVCGIKEYKGRYFSVQGLVKIYNKPEGQLSKIFANSRIYLKYSDAPLDKSDELNKIREKSYAFDYEKKDSTAEITATRDPYIIHANISKIIEYTFITYAVTEIADCAFANCRYLQSVTLGEDVERIGDSAFHGCLLLSDIIIRNAHIYYIGEGAFRYCKSLKKLDLRNTRDISQQHTAYLGDTFGQPRGKILRISMGSFAYSGLEEIYFPDDTEVYIEPYAFSESSLKKITVSELTVCKENAFANCKSLESVIFEEGVTEIKPQQFNGCRIKNIVIPSTLVKIDEKFMCSEYEEKWPSFNSVKVAENNPVYRAENDCLIEREGERLISWQQGAEIPSSVKIISAIALKEVFNLKNFVIPEGVEVVEDGAFDCLCFGCVTFPKSIKKIGYKGGSPNLGFGREVKHFDYDFKKSLQIKPGERNSKKQKLEKVETNVRFKYKGTVAEINEIVNKEEIRKGNRILIECSDGVFEYLRED